MISVIHRWRWLDSAAGSRLDGTLLCVSAGGRVLDRVALRDEVPLMARLAGRQPDPSSLRALLDAVISLGRPGREALAAGDLAAYGALLARGDSGLWDDLLAGTQAGAWSPVARWRRNWLLANVDNDYCREVFMRVLGLVRQALSEGGSLRLERPSGDTGAADATVVHVARPGRR